MTATHTPVVTAAPITAVGRTDEGRDHQGERRHERGDCSHRP